ncbi:DeoR/GlpR family DNA-binding transcription regulator [Microcella sp.]|uniref:DeoR/GlpR family DNA-binding transcription regulator n=1 Tax=Microcella sp. TaxID=1913979 RepID=UPI00255F04EB|nr:DeoR/GlpR family DNA-binding transcription regulator [Microcella sp.]MBX9471995.1 DeoR/GlpR family DNA-binding transcription regulator [Microcella sp.]
MVVPLPASRRARLLEILERDGAIRLESAAAELAVSVMTVRRDIQDLDADGLVRRVRGGAVSIVLPRVFGDRAMTRASAKNSVARKAEALVPSVGAVGVDASTTSGALLAIIRCERLLVVTNSVDNAAIARARPGVRAVLAGGEFEQQTGSLVGPTAEQTARSFAYDVFFTSASAVDAATGTMEVSLEEAAVKHAFAARARTTVVLADSSKLGQQALALALEWNVIDTLVTELDPSDDRLDPFRGLVEIL